MARSQLTVRLIAALLVVMLAAGCASPGAKRFYTVRKGDTLYSIAFRHGLNYQDLAKRNEIQPPYTIYIGQQLVIRGAKFTEPVKKSAPAETTPAPAALPVSAISWHWPLEGDILKPFSLSGALNKGIDIAGSEGAAVRAAADGVVVYAGGNLRGYGKLVIIKHGDDFLSAYGNNRSIKVREGQTVRQGQKISEVGINRDRQALLHFEIRRDGKPLDPTRYLLGPPG